MAILALDVSKVRTGWALHQPGMERPHFGAFGVPRDPDEVGKSMEAMRLFLAGKHEAFGLTDIVIEKQHLGSVTSKVEDEAGNVRKERRLISPDTIDVLTALAHMVDWFSFRIGARFRCVPIQSHRKHFIGRGDYPKKEAKQRALDVCRQLGWFVPNDDAAEACSILDYYLSLIRDYDRPWRDALMMKGFRA